MVTAGIGTANCFSWCIVSENSENKNSENVSVIYSHFRRMNDSVLSLLKSSFSA
jgi:hypothetical protein